MSREHASEYHRRRDARPNPWAVQREREQDREEFQRRSEQLAAGDGQQPAGGGGVPEPAGDDQEQAHE